MFKKTLQPLLITLMIIAPVSGAVSLKPGERFPDLRLPLISGGKESSLAELTDKKLMLHLFASW